MSDETMNDTPASMPMPPEDLPEVERVTATSKPNSKSRLFIGIAAGCFVVLCLCCVGIVGAMVALPSQFAPIIDVLSDVAPGVIPQSSPTSVRGGLPGVPGAGVPGQKPAATIKPPLGGQPSPIPSPQARPTTGGGVALGNPFADAAAKAKTAQKYRIEFSFIAGSTTNGKFEELPILDMKGVVDGANSQFEMKGGLFGAMGGGSSMEFAQVDGKSYIRGLPLPGATAQQWYVTKDSSMSGGTETFAKPDYFNDFTSGAKAGDIKKIRSESVDGQSCDVYSYDYKSLQSAALVGLLGSAKDKEDFSAVDKSEMLMWLCADGYVHKFTFDFQAHNAKDPKEKGSLKMNGHMWDFNNPALKVTAPANAKPFPGQ